MSDSLDAVLDELVAEIGDRKPPVPFAADGLLQSVELHTHAEVTEAFACSERSVRNWRSEEWWPGTHDPEPLQVNARALDVALRDAGMWTASARHANQRRQGVPRLAEPPLSSEAPGLFDLDALQELDPSESITEDVRNARRMEVKLRSYLEVVRPEALLNPAHIRAFNTLSETYGRTLQRIAQQEQTLLRVAKDRGELVEVEASQEMVGRAAQVMLGGLGDLLEAIVDSVKAQELEAHGKSRIDGLTLRDSLEQLAADFRAELVERLEAEVEVEADDGDD